MGVWKNTALYSIILLVFNDLEIERSIIMTKMKEKLPFIKIIYFDKIFEGIYLFNNLKTHISLALSTFI